MLDIDFLGLITRPGAIELGENSLFHEHVEILLISEVAFHVLRSEEEPVFSLRAGDLAFLQIRSKRGNTCAGSNHNNRRIGIFWQMKVFCVAGENRHGHVVRALGKK